MRRSGQGVDDFAGLGVMELFAGFMLDGAGAGFETIDVVAKVSVLLLEVLDLFLELFFLGALLIPSGQTVAAVDDTPEKKHSECDGKDRAGGTPTLLNPEDSAFLKWKRLVGHFLVFTE